MRPELEIRVEEKDTFREVINDSIDIERRLAANSALRRNKNMEYSKNDEPTNNKNSKVTRFNVAREDKFVCLICKNPGHATEKCFHLSKAQKAVLNKQQKFLYPNQQRYNNSNGQRSGINNTYEKEALAIIFCVTPLRPYLYGRKFTSVNDNKPLVWFQNSKDPCSRVSRWRLNLAEYDFDVISKQEK